MKIYKVVVKKEVFNDLSVIKDFIVTVASVDSAMKYVDALEQEIYSLAYLAPCIALTTSRTAKKYHPQARKVVTHNKKWTIIFHIEGSFAVVDKILPAKMMIS